MKKIRLQVDTSFSDCIIRLMSNTEIKWAPKADGGYEDKANGIVLAKVGRQWFITVGSRTESLGKKARFDHAEAAALRLMK